MILKNSTVLAVIAAELGLKTDTNVNLCFCTLNDNDNKKSYLRIVVIRDGSMFCMSDIKTTTYFTYSSDEKQLYDKVDDEESFNPFQKILIMHNKFIDYYNTLDPNTYAKIMYIRELIL